MDVQENTKGLRPIRVDEGRRPSDTLTSGELTSLRSVVGSLAWIARYGRPDLAYRVNDLQKSCNPKGTVSALKEANKTVAECSLQIHISIISGQSRGLDQRSGCGHFQ